MEEIMKVAIHKSMVIRFTDDCVHVSSHDNSVYITASYGNQNKLDVLQSAILQAAKSISIAELEKQK